MDTSKTYIKMCEKAEEIQFILHKCIPEGTYWVRHHKDGAEAGITGYNFKIPSDTIILPRQDQLQEMIFDKREITIPTAMVRLLNDWWKGNTTGHITSMEQLWLAFVMKEKYNKVWDGEQWLQQ